MKPSLQKRLPSCIAELCCRPLLSVIFFLVAFPSLQTEAQGNLLITPRRVVFEGQKKMHELNLANTGRDTARYLISFIEIKMKEDGTFEQISQPEPGQYFASSYLRLFPRTVMLAPNESQVIKVQLTKSSELAQGEYRSHLYFRAVPAKTPLGQKAPENDSAGIIVKLTPVFGITIPVIVRVGATAANVSISDLSLTTGQDGKPGLNMVFNRSGDMSVYGDLTIEFISAQGRATKVGAINGIAVYTPTSSRKINVKLSNVDGIDFKTGKLRVVYTAPSEAKSVKIAESELLLF